MRENLGGVPGHVVSVKMAAVDHGPGDAALWSRAARASTGSIAIRVPSGTAYRVTANAQVGSVRITVPRTNSRAHVIQAVTGIGTVTVTGR